MATMDLKETWNRYRELSAEVLANMTRGDIDFAEIDALADVCDNIDGNRHDRVKAMECLMQAGRVTQYVYRHLALRDSLKQWVFLDMQAQGDMELVYLALNFLGHICTPLDIDGESRLLPENILENLGSNLVDFLIEMVAEYEIAVTEDDDRRVQLVQDASVFALLAINAQFDCSDVYDNRVLNKLMMHQKDHSQELAHKFIIILNRGNNKLAMPLVVKMMDTIFGNEITSKLFFFTDDLKVLVEVILREVVSTGDLTLRVPYLQVLHLLLKNSIYPDLLHRRDEVAEVLTHLSGLEEGSDNFDAALKEKAALIIKECPYIMEEG